MDLTPEIGVAIIIAFVVWPFAVLGLAHRQNRRAAASELIAQFPRAIRRHGLGHLPENARHVLKQKGADACELERVDPLPYGVRTSERKERTVVTIFIGVLLLALFLMIVGFVTVIQWII